MASALLYDVKYAICDSTDSIILKKKSEKENRKSSDQSASDEKIISDATDFVETEKDHVNNSIEKFDKKGLIGLWWDAKGFFNVSDKEGVSGCMKVYNEINESILKCIELAANDDESAYQQILDLYKKIQTFKKTADDQANGKSKALCNVAKNFLDKHMILHHHLKQVECVLLGTDVKQLKETVNELKETAKQGIRNFERVMDENRELKNSVGTLKEENKFFKQQLTKLMKDNEDFKKILSKKS